LQEVLQVREAKGNLTVLFYGRGDYTTTLWSVVCGIDHWNVQPVLNGNFLWHRRERVLLLAIRHPARGRIGIDQEADFMPEMARLLHNI
jgi:hypothetical protein